MRREAGVPFYMYKPDRLMEHARDRLGLEVTDAAIDEAKGLRAEAHAGADPRGGSFAMLEHAFLTGLRPLDDEEEMVARHYYLGQESIEEIAAKQGTEEAKVSRLLAAASGKLGLDLDQFSPASRGGASFWPTTPRRTVAELLLNRYRPVASRGENAGDFGGAEPEPREEGSFDRLSNEVAVRLLLRALPPEQLRMILLKTFDEPDRDPGS